MRQQKTLGNRIEARIVRKRGEDVFLSPAATISYCGPLVAWYSRSDWCGLVMESMAAPTISRLLGEPILFSPTGFLDAARQALGKLRFSWEPTDAERGYYEGRSKRYQ
jgi:hypothetical protein